MFLAEFYKNSPAWSLLLSYSHLRRWFPMNHHSSDGTPRHRSKIHPGPSDGVLGPDGPGRDRSGAGGCALFPPNCVENHLFRVDDCSEAPSKTDQHRQHSTKRYTFSMRRSGFDHWIQAEFNFPTCLNVWRETPWSLLCIVPLLCRRHSLGRVVPIATQAFLPSDCGSRAAC